MTFSAKKAIQARRSVRSFDDRPLSAEDQAALEQYIGTVQNPFGVPVEFRLLDVRKQNLSSPVITGAQQYIAAKVRKEGCFEIGFGYSFEAACLYAASRGIGTVMLAASLSRAAFEKAMEIQGDEVMPVASPIGYPAAKKSIRETLMRTGLKADDRIPFEKLFFSESFETGLKKEDAGVFAEALEMARWAPSATNRQPWRAVVVKDTVHFYEKQTLKESPLGDVQKVDVGIALCHFDLVMQEDGYTGHFLEADPGLRHDPDVHYIISYQKS